MHVVVATHLDAVIGEFTRMAAACDTTRGAIAVPTLQDRLQVDAAARCRRPACARLYLAAQRARDRDQDAARIWLAEHPWWELDFVRERATNSVHVKPPPLDEPRTIAWGDGAAFIDAMLTPMTMLCGTPLHVDPFSEHRPTSQAYDQDLTLIDTDLCRGCVTALGEQARRAFEHPQPHDRARD